MPETKFMHCCLISPLLASVCLLTFGIPRTLLPSSQTDQAHDSTLKKCVLNKCRTPLKTLTRVFCYYLAYILEGRAFLHPWTLAAA